MNLRRRVAAAVAGAATGVLAAVGLAVPAQADYYDCDVSYDIIWSGSSIFTAEVEVSNNVNHSAYWSVTLYYPGPPNLTYTSNGTFYSWGHLVVIHAPPTSGGNPTSLGPHASHTAVLSGSGASQPMTVGVSCTENPPGPY